MNGWLGLAAAMIVVGAAAGAPGLFLVAAMTAGYGTLTRLWTRYGVDHVEYRRDLAVNRAVAGDTVPLDITIWNRKRLPLPWIAADDPLTDGIGFVERETLERDEGQLGRRVLHNAWSLAWYERVVRHFHLAARRRGVFEFGPARLWVRDIFGRHAGGGTAAGTDRLVIGPRNVPVRLVGSDAAPIGERRARRSLYADPALFGGVRPFQPGDSTRQIHWRATARAGTPLSRRFEPARGQAVVIALDVQTVAGPHWEMSYDDEAFESLCVAAISITRQLLAGGASVGIAAAGFTGTLQRTAFLAPQAAHGQLGRAAELLARIGPVSSAPYERLLTWLTRRVPPGCLIVTLSWRDPVEYLPAMQRLARSGYQVEHVALGPDARMHAAAVRRGGLTARGAALDPGWEEAHALVVAG
jgi:uncharacterized protein (DUF58 family)